MLRIIPAPKNMEMKNGAFCLRNVFASVDESADGRLVAALLRLCKEIEGKTGEKVPLSPSAPAGRMIEVKTLGKEGEGYSLRIGEDGITVEGDSSVGAFWGLQTLFQIVAQFEESIPCLEIRDLPDLSYRGFYLDITRGRVPTLKKLKEIADLLASFKINSLQLYVEDAFTFKELQGIVTENEALTPGEMKEFSEYCHSLFIDLVPSISTFGHLFTLLQSERYNRICELSPHEMSRHYWLERQWHHTVDVYDPETVKVIGSMIEQYMPLFSSEYFNICCDETMDLCKGKNEGKDKGEAYFHHVDKLCEIVASHNKKVMLWGDECMARPDMAKEHLPEDCVVLNWCYRREVAEWIPKMFWERGFRQIACTSTSSHDDFIENIIISTGNIESFAAHAKKYGLLGLLNTNWGDFGHVCAFSCNLYGMLFGAEKSWNVESETGEEYERAASRLLYGVESINMADTLRKLARASMGFNWSRFVMWYSAVTVEGKDMPLRFGGHPEHPRTAESVAETIRACQAEEEKLLSLAKKGEGDKKVLWELILACRGIILMNKLLLYINGADGCEEREGLQMEFDSWMQEYSSAWLCDNKPSGLGRIQEIINSVTTLPQNPVGIA